MSRICYTGHSDPRFITPSNGEEKMQEHDRVTLLVMFHPSEVNFSLWKMIWSKTLFVLWYINLPSTTDFACIHRDILLRVLFKFLWISAQWLLITRFFSFKEKNSGTHCLFFLSPHTFLVHSREREKIDLLPPPFYTSAVTQRVLWVAHVHPPIVLITSISNNSKWKPVNRCVLEKSLLWSR